MSTTQSLAGKRINSLLDESSFVEIGGRVTARNTDFNLSGEKTPSDGVITGYGVIEGNLVYVYSQDASVLGGTIGEMHAGKIARLYELAIKMGAPVIGLLDCAGLRLQEATDALDAFGKVYAAQVAASGVVPQITGIFGVCGGGLAVASALSDFTFMEKSKGRLFVNSPNAIEGNDITKCDTSAPDFQLKESGCVDFAGSQEEILERMRRLVAMLPANNEEGPAYEECADDLNRACENLADYIGDSAIALSYIADNNEFFQLKEAYAPDMVTGLLQLNGCTVGAVANRSAIYNDKGKLVESPGTVLSARGAQKAAEFVGFCDAFNIPLLTLTSVTGYKAAKCTEKRIAKAVGKLTYAFANASVPKVNVIVGEAYGSAFIAMNSKAIGADIVYAWPEAKIGMMNATEASRIMYADEEVSVQQQKAAEYEQLQSSIDMAAARGVVDAVIEAEYTRKYVIGAFEMLFTKREIRPAKKHGTV